jgi:hypothetical protein
MTDQFREIEAELKSGKGWLIFDDFISNLPGEVEISQSLIEQACKLGRLVEQNEAGEICCRVEDAGVARDSPLVRGYMTRDALPLHNDRADILILHSVRPSQHGGETQIVTAETVVNAMEARFPEHLSTLRADFPYDLRRPKGTHGQGWAEIPIVNTLADFESIWFCHEFVESCQRFENCPSLSQNQRQAVGALVEVLADPNIVETIKLEASQTLILNNLRVLHGRASFSPSDNVEAKDRLMLRVWVAPSWSPDLPNAFLPLFHNVKGGAIRGGYRNA